MNTRKNRSFCPTVSESRLESREVPSAITFTGRPAAAARAALSTPSLTIVPPTNAGFTTSFNNGVNAGFNNNLFNASTPLLTNGFNSGINAGFNNNMFSANTSASFGTQTGLAFTNSGFGLMSSSNALASTFASTLATSNAFTNNGSATAFGTSTSLRNFTANPAAGFGTTTNSGAVSVVPSGPMVTVNLGSGTVL
jgi:hypothetical protein